jgi:hypothetical protein
MKVALDPIAETGRPDNLGRHKTKGAGIDEPQQPEEETEIADAR